MTIFGCVVRLRALKEEGATDGCENGGRGREGFPEAGTERARRIQMRRAIIAESHRRDKSQEYLNIHRDNKLTKAEGVFGDLRLMGRGGTGSMCSLVCS